MYAYFFIFFIVFLWSLQQMRPASPSFVGQTMHSLASNWIFLIILSMFIGLRHYVGGDWSHYQNHVELAKELSFWDAVNSPDPSYMILNWLGGNYFGGIYLVNFVCAIIFSSGLLVFCNQLPIS